MTGWDFNGVVDTGRFLIEPDDVIITGNTYHIDVLDYLQEHHIKARVYFFPDTKLGKNRNAVAVWKSEMIRRIGVDRFYEDDSLQAQIIRDSCPNCTVEQVG